MAEKRRIVPEDLYRLVFVSDPQISPDGTKIAYVRTRIDEKTKEYRSEIWMAPTNGRSKPVRFTQGPKSDTSPRWSPDGSMLAFVSDRSGDRQIYVMPATGGEARRLTSMRYGADNPVWSPDGKKIAFTAKIDPAESKELWQTPLDSKAKEALEKKKTDEPTVVTRLEVKSDALKGLIPPYRQALFVQGIDEETAHLVVEMPVNAGMPAWSPDGTMIAFSAAKDLYYEDYYPWYRDVYVVSSCGGEPRRLTPAKGPSVNPVFTKDGQYVIYVGHQSEAGGPTMAKLWKVPVSGGEPQPLMASFDGSVGDHMAGDVRFGASPNGPTISSDGSTVYFLSSQMGCTGLFAVPVNGGDVKEVVSGRRQIFGFSLDASGSKFALGISSPENPGEISVFDLASGEERFVTSENKAFLDEVLLSLPKFHEFKADDGYTLYGWVMKPVGYKESVRYPAILEVHGGPHSMYGHNFFFEFQVLASQGYAVVYTNPRGGEGFGQAFLSNVIGDYGGRDYEDLMDFVDFCLGLGFIDENRLGVTGGSYGGFMTNWIVGHTNRFKAAVTQRSISNWLSFYGVSDIGWWFTEREQCGNPWDNFEKLWKHSPLAYVKNVTTPLLILHSENDQRCPIEQGEQFYIALKRLEKETKMVRFPGSNHELSRSGKPCLRVSRLNHIVTWFNDHICRTGSDYDPTLSI